MCYSKIVHYIRISICIYIHDMFISKMMETRSEIGFMPDDFNDVELLPE